MNGSYVVYRKLQQDVAGFWQFMKREAVRVTGAGGRAATWSGWRRAASGAGRAARRWRWRPHADDPRLRDRDDFLYRDDPDGLACPLGAHVRRTNPRDDIKPYPAAESLSMSEAHRLLRRARVFGPALFDPAVLADPDVRRVPQPRCSRSPTTAARAAFISSASTRASEASSSSCSRPGATTRASAGSTTTRIRSLGDNDRNGRAVEPHDDSRRPLRLRTAALPRFVTVKAGAYLFMPSLKALRFLSSFSAGVRGV